MPCLPSPQRDVELMGTLVSGVAVAAFPVPVPVVMEAIAIERPLRRRTEPEIVIDLDDTSVVRRLEAGGDAVQLHTSPGAIGPSGLPMPARGLKQRPRHVDLPEPAVLMLDRGPDGWTAPVHGADLDNLP